MARTFAAMISYLFILLWLLAVIGAQRAAGDDRAAPMTIAIALVVMIAFWMAGTGREILMGLLAAHGFAAALYASLRARSPDYEAVFKP